MVWLVGVDMGSGRGLVVGFCFCLCFYFYGILLTNIHIFGALCFTSCMVIQNIMVHFMSLNVRSKEMKKNDGRKTKQKGKNNFVVRKNW